MLFKHHRTGKAGKPGIMSGIVFLSGNFKLYWRLFWALPWSFRQEHDQFRLKWRFRRKMCVSGWVYFRMKFTILTEIENLRPQIIFKKVFHIRLKCLENIFLKISHGNASLWIPIYVCWCFRFPCFRVWRSKVWNPFVRWFFLKKLEKFEKIAIFDLKRLRVTPQKSQSLRLNDVLNWRKPWNSDL